LQWSGKAVDVRISMSALMLTGRSGDGAAVSLAATTGNTIIKG